MTQTELELAYQPKVREPRWPLVSSTQLWALLSAFRRGEKLTFLDAVERYGIAALSQRAGELRNTYGWPIKSQWRKLPSGKKIKEYFL